MNDQPLFRFHTLLATLPALLLAANCANAQLAGTLEPGDTFGNSVAAGDFDGDGVDDLAVGVPDEDVGALVDAGAVNVIYGTSSGLDPAGNQFFTQPALPTGPEAQDQFGISLATGDFNGDGFDDLAVGVPFETVGATFMAGAVNVFYGTAGGLVIVGAQVFTQPFLPDGPEASDLFGFRLTSGDFDDDGFDDLAVGVPTEDVGMTADAGAVNVFYGAAGGLTAVGAQVFTQPALPLGPESGDLFGRSLTSGDFNHDGFDDLAVGVPYEDVGAIADAGALNVFYGGAGGVTTVGAQVFTQPALPVGPEAGDGFGYSLASGDFDLDDFDDLAVGVPFQDHMGATDVGAVNAFYGAAGGLGTAGAQVFFQPAALGGIEAGDQFGYSLATAATFDLLANSDLVIGAPGEDLPAGADAGVINVLYGAAAGLTTAGSQVFTQPALPGGPEAGDKFGFSVATGSFDGGYLHAAAVGVPSEDIGVNNDAGAVDEMYVVAGSAAVWYQAP